MPSSIHPWMMISIRHQSSSVNGGQTAIERGEFQHSNGRVREDAILAVADSVASGMQLLHQHGVQHGDLSASAVLLTACKVRTSLPALHACRMFTAGVWFRCTPPAIR